MPHKVNSIDRIVGLNILLNRMAFGMELGELAKKLEITEELLSQIEEGEVRTGVSLLTKVAKVFDIPIAQLLSSMQLKSHEINSNNELITELHQLIVDFTKIKNKVMRQMVLQQTRNFSMLPG